MNNQKLFDVKSVMQLQPVINVGMIGHVANGKSSVVKQLSSKETQQFSQEKVQNITIRLGYANVKIWFCQKCNKNDSFNAYSSSGSHIMNKDCGKCKEDLELVSHISFVDCPGHHELTATMLNGACVMDYALLVESTSNVSIPAPQTAEHLMATRTANIPTCGIILNKIDLTKKQKTSERAETLKEYVSNLFDNSEIPPIIPVSATFGANMDVVCKLLSQLTIPPSKNPNELLKMIVIRSFDINKPGVDVSKLCGGVIGGTIMRGSLNKGDRVLIYPGMVKKVSQDQKKDEGPDYQFKPIEGEVLSIKSDSNELEFAIPGGLLGVQLTIDPAFVKSDSMAGSIVLSKKDVESSQTKSVNVYDKIIININNFIMKKDTMIELFKTKPSLIINVNSNNISCTVHKYTKKTQELFLLLNRPVAVDNIDNIATIIYKNSERKHNEIIGRGAIIDGVKCEDLL